MTNAASLEPSLCRMFGVAGPRLEEDAELRVFGGKGGDIVKSLNEDLDLQPASAEVRLRPLPTMEQTNRLFCGCASVSCACLM